MEGRRREVGFTLLAGELEGFGDKHNRHRKERKANNKSHQIGRTFWKDALAKFSKKIL